MLAAWQSFAPHATDELWSNCLLIASQHTPTGYGPVARVTGVYVGDVGTLETHVDEFVAAVGASPFDRFVGSAPYSQAMLIEAGCEGDSVAQCHLPSENPAGALTRCAVGCQVGLSRPTPSSGGNQGAPSGCRSPPGITDSVRGWSGARRRRRRHQQGRSRRDRVRPPGDLATLQYSANWDLGAPANVVAGNRAWLDSTWRSMQPFVTGQAYQNYIDPSLRNWQKAYYGSNLPRLQQIKRTYDPTDFFRFGQSIPPAEGAG